MLRVRRHRGVHSDVTASTPAPSITRGGHDPDSLGRLLAALDPQPEDDVALDTEADSVHHHLGKACLPQLAWDGTAHLVDPLAPLDVPALLARLVPRRLLMHGSDYDLRLLFRGYGFRATSLFDTMLAAQQIGRAHV